MERPRENVWGGGFRNNVSPGSAVAFDGPAWGSRFCGYIHTVSQKNIPDIFDCNLKTNYQILIISGTNHPDTTCHQTIVQFPTSPNVCFCTT